MQSLVRFPDANQLESCLLNQELFNNNYLMEKGITQAIALLAVDRFANSEKYEMGIDIGANLILYDLLHGKDGFSGKALPNFGELGLTNEF